MGKTTTKQNAYLICPVTRLTPEIREAIDKFIANHESEYYIYCPYLETDQSDPTVQIASHQNYAAIFDADIVLWWINPESMGSLFDLGIAWALRKPLKIVHVPEGFVIEDFTLFALGQNWFTEDYGDLFMPWGLRC